VICVDNSSDYYMLDSARKKDLSIYTLQIAVLFVVLRSVVSKFSASISRYSCLI